MLLSNNRRIVLAVAIMVSMGMTACGHIWDIPLALFVGVIGSFVTAMGVLLAPDAPSAELRKEAYRRHHAEAARLRAEHP